MSQEAEILVDRLRKHAGTLHGPMNDDMRSAANLLEMQFCNPSEWRGDPVFWKFARCNDVYNTYRIFHRDKPGVVIAEFYGDNAQVMAKRFCELFGEPDGSTTQQPNGDSGQ